ncbi:MAG: DUF420 domain-containing protein [Bacteroidetes bacterium]|jgi:putative membrane protein|nr:DUF420 domain-containing protein [Bacteroidota bacterium]MBK7567522.1 DUF420 domain-containing protein [Bacteroidota bacterium]MBP8916844.1 DUF420 domain-containing protein [Chitinophagales bacterium]MBP9794792.1 DUF420 domain-containing protein [Chitinophagales bacterium]
MSDKSINRIILLISIAVPLLVAILFYTPAIHLNINISFLPKFHAMLNSGVAILLLFGLYFIKNKNRKAHKISMMSAFSLSALFLISYVLYHSSTDATIFGDSNFDKVLSEEEKSALGSEKTVYYIILISHIILAAAILPFILITLSRSLTEKFDKHRKIARITWPLWFYVAVTGVVVYFMIAPYYPH